MNIVKNLVSSSKYSVKCPYSMTATRIVVHNTANDASARSEVSYMIGNNNQVSFHYAVDDKEVVQGIPENRNAWHAGDGNGKGNREGLSVEICYSKSGGEKFTNAEKNAAKFIAQLLKERGWGIDKVTKHQDYSGKYCPHRTLDLGWQRFLNMISSELNAEDKSTYSDPDGTVKDNTGAFQIKSDKFGEVSYQGHLRDYGWANWQCDGAMIGSTGQSRRVEALRIKPIKHMDVSVHIKNIGDRTYKNITKDTVIGTTGQGLRLEALKIESGDTVYLYRVHQKDIGWSAWCVNGQWAGTKGKSKQIEAVEIKVADIAYIAHVEETGDTIWMADGMTAGTTGQQKRLEAIRIKSQHCGDVEAKAHIQDEGWKDYGKINQNTVIGTEGDSLRLECLCLKGNFEWRAHIQGTGWTAWTDADGVSTLGTVGQSLRIEAIEMKAV